MTPVHTSHAPHTATPPAAPSDRRLNLAGRDVTVRLYGDPKASADRPAVLFFHGGRFTDGSLDGGDATAAWLAASGALVASVDYPLAPDHPFPAAVDTGHAALDWLHGLRGKRAQPVVVAGAEAGGNIAAAIATMARDRDPDQVAGQLLIVPLLDPCMASASSRAASVGTGGCTIACGWQRYLSQPADIGHPYAAPAAAVRLAGLAPLLLVSIAGHPLQDEGRRYVDRLRQAGVAASELEVPTDPRRDGWPDTAAARVREFLATAAAA